MPSRSPLDLDHDTMQRLGHAVTDVVAAHLSTLREQPAYAALPRGETLALHPTPPQHGTPFEALLDQLRKHVLPFAAREPHPGFVAYVPSCPTFPAVLGDWLATGYNFFAGAWDVAQAPNALELLVLNWFRQWLGMPEGSLGLLTSGGSAATLMAMIAARHAAVGDDAARLAALTVYASDQSHSSAIRAAWMAGVPRAHVRLIPCDASFRLPIEALTQYIARDRAAGLSPFLVIANAGTTNTGAVDPLPGLAELCTRERMWLHVDAAYGGFAVLTDTGRKALAGIELADSVTIDPHKWLYVPFECGCLMAREPERLKAAFHILPEYLQDIAEAEGGVNFADYGEQLSRYSRALKVWLCVSYFGVETLAAAIDASMSLSPHAEARVRRSSVLEVTAPAALGIVCFRAHPPGMDDPAELDALNERIAASIVAEGRFFLSTTRLGGRVTLRICPIGFRTTRTDIEELVDSVQRVALQLGGVAAGR